MRTHYALAFVGLLFLSAWASHTHGQQTASRRQNWEYRVDAVPGTERSVRMATEFDTPVMEGIELPTNVLSISERQKVGN